jgi:DNA-binding transcriptional regulator YiaG
VQYGYRLGTVTAQDLIRVRRMAATGAARAIRETSGLSLSELAEAAAVHKSTIYRWEHGVRRPRGAAAERYLRALEKLTA